MPFSVSKVTYWSRALIYGNIEPKYTSSKSKYITQDKLEWEKQVMCVARLLLKKQPCLTTHPNRDKCRAFYEGSSTFIWNVADGWWWCDPGKFKKTSLTRHNTTTTALMAAALPGTTRAFQKVSPTQQLPDELKRCAAYYTTWELLFRQSNATCLSNPPSNWPVNWFWLDEIGCHLWSSKAFLK